MPYDRLKHQRRSVRLAGYDYAAPGAYFVTICTRHRQMFFDELELRQLAEACWREIPAHAANVELDEWVVMPNHIHGLVVIIAHSAANDDENVGQNTDDQGRGVQLNAPTMNTMNVPTPDTLNDPTPRDGDNQFSVMSPRRNTLSVIMRTYKAALTTACWAAHRSEFAWQRGFYEHVVRNERELAAIRQYIRENPLKWALDRDNPANARHLAPPTSAADYLEDLALTPTS